jgi:hypothetical protein
MLDRSCNADADCALGAWNRCTIYARSDLLGMAAGELGALAELAAECGRPAEPADCPGEGGGISPFMTEDGLEPRANDLNAAVACVEGRCTSYSTRCGRDLCGNGSVDECRVSGDPPVFEQQFDFPNGSIEECDGEALGGRSCATHGYAGGTLRCLADACVTDPASCVACADASSQLITCRTDEAGSVQWLAVAASDDEVAVLYDRGELRLARFSPGLEPLGEVVLETSGDPVDWGTGAIARADGAWVAVATRIFPAGYSLLTLRDGGELVEETRSTGEIVDPFLMTPPDGPPVLVYGVLGPEGFGSAQALRVSDDLATWGDGRGLGAHPVSSGAWVGEAFLLTRLVAGQPELLRLDGALAEAPVAIPVSTVLPDPVWRLTIGSDGTAGSLLLDTSPAAGWIVEVDGMGTTLDNGVGYGLLQAPSAPVRVAAGVFLATSYTPEGAPVSGVELVGGNSSEFVAGAPIASPTTDYRAVALGDEIIVAFASDRGLGLARYRP